MRGAADVRRALLAAALALLPAACSAPVPRQHVVMFAADGSPLDPGDTGWLGSWLSGYGALLEPGDEQYFEQPQRGFDLYCERLVDGLRAWCDRSDLNRRVVLFIHGGMNSQPGSVERAQELSDQVLADGSYPIFVNWHSSLLNCYADHVFFVRQGSRAFGPRNDVADDVWDGLGVVLFPFQLAADLLRGLVRFPIVALSQLEGVVEWQDWGRSPEREAADLALQRIDSCAPGRPPLHFPIQSGLDQRPDDPGLVRVESVGGFLWWIVMLPVKAVTTMTVDAGGQGAWEVMRRRVELLFHPEEGLTGELRDRQPRGLLFVMQRLRQAADEIEAERRRACPRRTHAGCAHGLEITLVGHSMGAMVLNGLLEHRTLSAAVDTDEATVLACAGHDGEHACTCGSSTGLVPAALPACPQCRTVTGAQPELRLPRFDRVVYLAAACSVAEYEQAAFPYLLAEPSARVYHVVLHPRNERGENVFFDVAPRGSLLAWVDDFLAKPLTPLDRTAGSYSNLLPALHDTPRELRPRIHVRVLPWADDALPQSHTDFSAEAREDFRFWRAESWFAP